MYASLKQSRGAFVPSLSFTLKFKASKRARLLLFPSNLEEILHVCGDESTSSLNIRAVFKPLQDDVYGYYLLVLFPLPAAVCRGCLKSAKWFPGSQEGEKKVSGLNA